MKISSDTLRKVLASLLISIVGVVLVKTLFLSDDHDVQDLVSKEVSVEVSSFEIKTDESIVFQEDVHTSIQKNLEVSLSHNVSNPISLVLNDQYVDNHILDLVVQSDIDAERYSIDILSENVNDELSVQDSELQEQKVIELAENEMMSDVVYQEMQQPAQEKSYDESLMVDEEIIAPATESSAADAEVITVNSPKQNKSLRYPARVSSYSSSVATCFPHMIIQATAFFTIADKSFDNCHKKSSLSNLVFNQNVSIKDMLLISSLSAQNKVRIDNVPAREPDRQATPIGPNPGGVQWGGYSSDQYIRLLADTQLRMNLEQKESGISFAGTYRFALDCFEYATFAVGLMLPFKSQKHSIDFEFVGGSLFTEAFTADRTQRRDSSKDFFRTYIDVTDFFYRAILDPKGLSFSGSTQKSGIGDITLFGFADWAQCISWMDSLQTGVNLILPSGGKEDTSVVWGPVLGNGGAFAVDFFVNAIFNTCWKWLNPTLIINAEVCAPMNSNQRIPGLVQSPSDAARQQANTIPGLFAPPQFGGYWVDSFSQFSTSIPYFADNAVSTRIRYGSKVIVGIGNYAYNFFRPEFRFGFLYEYMYKAKDHVSVKDCGTFDTSVITKNTRSQAHIITWNIAYASKKGLEINLGGRYIIAGQNIPKQSEAFINMVVFF